MIRKHLNAKAIFVALRSIENVNRYTYSKAQNRKGNSACCEKNSQWCVFEICEHASFKRGISTLVS